MGERNDVPRERAPRRGGVLGSVRAVAASDWRELSRVGRVSVAGIAVSAVLALALGAFIPAVAEHHTIRARLESNVATVRLLEHHLPVAGGETNDDLDEVIQHELLGGPNLHVFLLSPQGEVLYADRQDLTGLRLPISGDLEAALAGGPVGGIRSQTSALAPQAREVGDQWLEFYVPVPGPADRVAGVLLVQQDFRSLARHLAAIQRAVWLAVGSGLSVLLVFLCALFAAANRAISRHWHAAEQRTHDLATLLATSQSLAAEPRLDRTAPLVLQELAAHLDLDGAAVAAIGPDGQTILAWKTGDIPAKCAHDPDVCDCVSHAIPLGPGMPHAGALLVRRTGKQPFTEDECDLLATVAGQIGVALENTQLFDELREEHAKQGGLLERLVNAQEEERRHLVGELHDGLGQNLTRILYGLRGTRARLDGAGGEVVAELIRLESLVETQSRDLRAYLAYIAPSSLDDFGLPAALRSLTEEHENLGDIEIHLDVGAAPAISRSAAITLFRAAQEAITNVRKHAEADQVWVALAEAGDQVQLSVEDRGKGAKSIDEGVGLSYMRDRAESLGGSMAVRSELGRGTRVVLRLPKEKQHVAGTRAGG